MAYTHFLLKPSLTPIPFPCAHHLATWARHRVCVQWSSINPYQTHGRSPAGCQNARRYSLLSSEEAPLGGVQKLRQRTGDKGRGIVSVGSGSLRIHT